MTINEFLKYSLGKSIDYDGAAEVQCVDLIKNYLKKVYNISPGAWGNAVDYYRKFNKSSWAGFYRMQKSFTRISNTPDLIPMKGDICVWSENISDAHDFGHIAIGSGDGTVKRFLSYDQNYGGTRKCRIVSHKYTHFLGVLRPKRKVITALNVRSGPDTSYQVIDELKERTVIVPVSENGAWTQIAVGQWVCSKYLKLITH